MARLRVIARALHDYLLLSFKVASHAFLAAEIAIPSENSLPDGGLFGNIGLTEGILNELLYAGLPSGASFSPWHLLNKEVKDSIEDEKQNDI